MSHTADREPEATKSPADAGGEDPLIGTLLHHKYRLVRCIGVGGFGTVYEARDERGAGNRVAIKVVRSQYSSDPKLVKAFRSEARRMTRLSHPNIVDWKNFDEDENHNCYFAMELVEGEELDRVLAQTGPMEPKRVALLLLQILDALRAAHHLPDGSLILHLDLKPRNLFLIPPRAGRPEQVKVIDFGIGQHIGAEVDDASHTVGVGARTDTLGDTDFNPSSMHFSDASESDPPGFRRCHGCTPEYVAPEQAAHVMGRPDVLQLDGRADLYALGVIAFQMLTGELPFAPPIVRTDYIRLHMDAQPRSLSATGAKVPRALARFVERCLEKNREDRFGDTHAAYAAMHRIVHPSSATRIALISTALVGCAFAFGGYWMRGGGSSDVLASDGLDLVPGAAIHMGPSSRTRELYSRKPDVFDPNATLRLVEANEGTDYPGSRVVRLDSSRVRVEVSGEPSLYREARAVRIEGADVRLESFELVWLGSEAWHLSKPRIQGVDLGDSLVVLDPRGLDLELALTGAGRNDVSRLAAQVVGGQEIEMVSFGVRREERMFRADLGLLGLTPGRARISLRGSDRALGAHDTEFEVEVVETALSASIDLCESKDDGSRASFNRMADRFLLPPGSRAILRVAPNRNAVLEWRVLLEDALPRGDWNKVAAAVLHEVPLELPMPDANSTLRGYVETVVDESAHVVHVDPEQRGRVRTRVPFTISSERADFVAAVEISTRERIPLTPDQVTWIAAREHVLVVERRGRPAMSLRLADGRSGVMQADQHDFRFRSNDAEDGLHPVEISAFRMDTSEQPPANEPDMTRRYTLGIDTQRPEFEPPMGLDGARFDTADEIQARVLPERAFEGGGSLLTLRWRLSEESSGLVRSGTCRNTDDALTLRALFEGAHPLPDGRFRLEWEGRDEAGNEANPVASRFEIALLGPDLELQAPRAGNWLSEEAGWLVQVRATDPNGVGSARCVVRCDGVPEIERILERSAGTANEAEFRAHVPIPHEWSARAARIEVEAFDRAGRRSTATREGLLLPVIRPPRPLALRSMERDAPILRLVPGNAGTPYVFGGRGDDVENADHRRAGLRAFAQQDATRSWVVNYDAGAIADFYLDEREVTGGEYLAFLRDAHGYAAVEHWPMGAAGPTAERRTELETRFASTPDLPATDVSWEEAAAFAHWNGRRLPSWVELEYAARGGPSSYRPFAGFEGSAPDPGSINAKGSGPGNPWRAGEGADITPDTRIRDLAGNVAEWTGTPLSLARELDPGDRAAYFREHRAAMLTLDGAAGADAFWLAGGSFRDENYFFEAAAARPRTWRGKHVGFRCALSIEGARRARDEKRFEDAP